MRHKIAFAVHMLPPYRVSFYKKLFSNEEYEWKLFAGNKDSADDSRPQHNGNVDFNISYHQEKINNRGIYRDIDYQDMYNSIKEFNPDIIILFAHVGTKSFRKVVKWAKSNNRKVIMWTCFWEPDYMGGYKRVIRNYFIKKFYRKADYHITYSSLAREKLLKIGYPDQQISIAYNGIDTDLYEQEMNDDNRLIDQVFDPAAINCLYVGGFGKDKKVDLLIRAISECNAKSDEKINAYLIGDGPMSNEYRTLVKTLKISDQVKFLGRITSGLGHYIKAADFVVLPGTGGLVLNEAILFEKPLIVSEADGTEYDLLLNGYNGIKFQSDNVSSLANALMEIAENHEFFKQNASNISEIVNKRSNVDSMVSTFLMVIKKANNENVSVRWRTAIIPESRIELQGSKY